MKGIGINSIAWWPQLMELEHDVLVFGFGCGPGPLGATTNLFLHLVIENNLVEGLDGGLRLVIFLPDQFLDVFIFHRFLSTPRIAERIDDSFGGIIDLTCAAAVEWLRHGVAKILQRFWQRFFCKDSGKDSVKSLEPRLLQRFQITCIAIAGAARPEISGLQVQCEQ